MRWMTLLSLITMPLILWPQSVTAQDTATSPHKAQNTLEDLNSYWTPERMRNAKPMDMGVIETPENPKPLIPNDNNLKISQLIEEMGEKQAIHLGYITRISQETLIVTHMGEDYLSKIRAKNIKSPAEAFAAGFKSANSP